MSQSVRLLKVTLFYEVKREREKNVSNLFADYWNTRSKKKISSKQARTGIEMRPGKGTSGDDIRRALYLGSRRGTDPRIRGWMCS
jgi:hypothetical protein